MNTSQPSSNSAAPNPNTAMPQFTQKPIPGGSIYTAGVVAQKTQAEQQTALVGSQKGGIKKSRLIGGDATVPVPQPPSYAVDKGGTIANNKALTQLAVSTQNNSAYDTASSQADTAKIAAQQAAIQVKNGGSKKRRSSRKKSTNKRGGSWPVWGCLSGGKKTKKHTKKCKCKRRIHKKNKSHRHS